MLSQLTRAVRNHILNIGDYVILSYQSLASRWSVTLLNFAGIVLAVALLSSAGFFAQAVDRAILMQELDAFSKQTGRDPFSLQVYILPTGRRPLSLLQAEQVADDLADTLSSEIGLPLGHLGTQVESGSLMLLAHPDDERYAESDGYLASVETVYIDSIDDQIDIVDGVAFGQAGADPAVLDVWMHVAQAEKMGLVAGETLRLGLNARQPMGDVKIAGLWQARDANDPFWFADPEQTMTTALLVSREEYRRAVEPAISAKSRYAAWHIILDDGALNPAHAQGYVDGFEHAMTVIDRYLPGATLNVSPLEPLQEFTGRQTLLITQLLAFNLPALIFLLYFLSMVAQIVVSRQHQEISILVSRGMPRSTLTWMTILEQVLLFLPAVPLGLAGGLLLARGMGYSAGFLSFTTREALPVSLQGLDLRLVLIALALTLLARLIPVFQSASRTLVERERERARPTTRPFWQRAYIDVLLIIPTAYVYRQLLQQGSFADPTADGSAALFQDPLLVLAPALFVITTTLLLMRFFPMLMTGIDWLAARLPWFVPHMALRQLGRHSADYSAPLLLVIVLLAQGIYTVSMAASLDQWLVDRVYYQAGADARFLPMRMRDGDADAVVVPPNTFDSLPGVAATARVGDFPVNISMPDGTIRGRYLAVDRLTFPTVGWFRPDFAGESLGALMNRLAHSPDSILVSEGFLDEHVLRVGDQLTMHVAPDTAVWVSDSFTIVGSYAYFPTVADDEVVVIGSQDFLLLMTGTEFPQHYWVRFQEETSPQAVHDAVGTTGLTPAGWYSAPEVLAEEQSRLERVGIFGTLTVGFGAAAVMAILALLLHGAASLQRRGYQFGILRALGLDRRPLLLQVGLEYTLLTLYGTLAGAAIGIATALLFTPFFRITEGDSLPLPPLIPEIAWDDIMLFALFFALGMIVVESILVARGVRGRLFSILRLGQIG